MKKNEKMRKSKKIGSLLYELPRRNKVDSLLRVLVITRGAEISSWQQSNTETIVTRREDISSRQKSNNS